MTGNQISYWNLQETMRSNKANEAIKSDTLQETKRSNRVNENIKTADVNSQIRRREFQNGNDTANTVINGIGTGGKLFSTLTSVFK